MRSAWQPFPRSLDDDEDEDEDEEGDEEEPEQDEVSPSNT